MTKDYPGPPTAPASARDSAPPIPTGDVTLGVLEALAALPSADHERFLDRATRLAANAFAAEAWLAVFADVRHQRLRVLARHPAAAEQPPDFELSGSPCAEVLRRGELLLDDGVASRYPDCEWLGRRGLRGYRGVVLAGRDGAALGVLAVADRRPLSATVRPWPLLPVFAARIAGELEGQVAQRQLALAASAFEHLPQAVMLTDSEQRIVRVNPAFCRITGWTADAVMGRSAAVLSAGLDPPGVRDDMQAALADGGYWLGELWSRRSDGEVFPEQRSVVAICDRQQRVVWYLNVFSDISEEKFTAERVHRLAHYDATTELPNRVLLQDRLLQAINRASRDAVRLAVLFLDLDGFKQINDVLGHAAGDELLRQVGVRLTGRLRKADVVARVGGDEFAVVISDVGQDSDVQAICDQLLEVITEPFPLDGRTGRVTTSIGIAVYPDDGSDAQALLKHADAAMYQAKQRGKNRYAFYAPETNRRAEKRLQLTRRLRRAIRSDGLSLCYQPQYDLATGRVVAVEALVRWRDDDGRLVEPTRFIPLAEETGLIVPLGAWVLDTACRHAVAWRAQGLEFGRLAVNVSGRQFHGEALREAVDKALAESGLPPERLELEITESWVMEGPYKAETQMRALHELGVNLVVDDFGLANSSLGYLKRLPVQKLKIDRSFIRSIPGDADDSAIVSAIIAMGHSLGLRVVAEGVELPEQSAFLRGTGCDEGQGFLFGRPVPPDEMNVQLLYLPPPAE